MKQVAAKRGHVVCGELHDEGAGLAGKPLGLLEHDAGNDDGGDAHEVEQRHNPPGLGVGAHKRAHEQGDDGSLGTAGHERRRHGGHAALVLVLDGLRGHDTGNAAARGDEHRDERLARQAEAAEHAVHDERDAGHVAAVLKQAQEGEEHDHLRHEAQDCAHTADNAVDDQALDPRLDVGTLKGIADNDRDAGDVGTEIMGVDAVSVVAGSLDRLVIGLLARAEEPTVAKDAVVGPVRAPRTHRHDGDIVHQAHDHDKDRDAEPAVRDNAVDLLSGGDLLGSLLEEGRNHRGDEVIALRRHDGFCIVLKLLLHGGRDGLHASLFVSRKTELLDGRLVALEKLDGVPALESRRRTGAGDLVNLGKGVLHLVGELDRGGSGLLGGSSLLGGSDDFVNASAPQRRAFNDRAAEKLRKLRGVNDVAVLLEQVGHVQGDDDGKTELKNLGGQIQAALDVRGVDKVDHDVGAVVNQIVARTDLFGRIGRQRVNAGQVGDDNVLVAEQLCLLLFNGYAGPVSDITVFAGNTVKQRGFTAVGVAGESNLNAHSCFLLGIAGEAPMPHLQALWPVFALDRPSGRLLLDDHILRFVFAKRQLVAAYGDLDGVSQRCDLANMHRGTLRDAHVHDAALECTLTGKAHNDGVAAHGDIAQRFHLIPPLAHLILLHHVDVTSGLLVKSQT